MKKLIIVFISIMLVSTGRIFANNNTSDNFTGRWAEKLFERVVMDIYQDKDEYQIFITWREDNLTQKDIYRFKGKSDHNGNIEYKDGVHIYRIYDEKNNFVDKTDYTDGSGLIIMNNHELIWFDNVDNTKTEFIRANKDLSEDTTVKSKKFSVTLPEELRGFYETEKERNKISFFHKESKSAGFGGFAFGIKAYRKPADHAVLPGSKKLGEIRSRWGVLYDVVLKHPTDVQYDYTKSQKAPETFALLYDIGEVLNIKGINGSTYYKNQGTKGEDLYKKVLQKHITAINEKWDSTKLEKENMSYMYNITDKEKIGYAYYDINVDGIDELLIGEIADGAWKGVVYDIYTMVNRKPKHVISGGSRNRYFVCDGSFICNEYSSGANESGVRTYILVENSTDLYPQVSFKYDGYTNPDKPWFISYGNEVDEDKWENVSEETYNERKQVFEKYERFDFIPLNKETINTQTLEDKYNPQKDYFDYSVVLAEFPKDYYYTTVKINKSKERILIITDKVNADKTANYGLFYYFGENGFVYPLGYLKSTKPLSQSKDYLYLTDKNKNIRFYMSDHGAGINVINKEISRIDKNTQNIVFETIESADRFAGGFGSAAGDDVVKISVDGFWFEYHKPQYKRKYIKNLMKECINDGVKTQVQMYCCMVKKLHP